MKIIGKSGPSTYLVEVHGSDLAKLSGSSGTSSDQWAIGTKLMISESYFFLSQLRANEENVKKGVKAMSAIGEMLGQTLPSFVVSPPAKETAPDGDPS